LNFGLAYAENNDGRGFEGSASNPTPSSDHTPPGRRCALDRAASLFAFNIFRFGNILDGKLSQLYLRSVITDILGVPLTFCGLFSQVD
jgi:hypothetical protein